MLTQFVNMFLIFKLSYSNQSDNTITPFPFNLHIYDNKTRKNAQQLKPELSNLSLHW